MSTQPIRIATRKSPLALWQAEHVRDRLLALHPGLQVELLKMSTQGDRILDSPLAKIGGKGLFVKELEQGMLDGRADLAVHSMKDVPAELPDGLCLGAILDREDPRDAFVSAQYPGVDDLPEGARVGTSSLRRQCQLRARRPDLQIVLACAGLKRLGLSERITHALTPEEMLPAIAQGVIGIECCADDMRVRGLIEPLNHAETAQRTAVERAMNATLAGGCQAPVAGYSLLNAGVLELRGLVGQPDGSQVIRGDVRGAAEQAEALGKQLADDLLARGADTILAELLRDG